MGTGTIGGIPMTYYVYGGTDGLPIMGPPMYHRHS